MLDLLIQSLLANPVALKIVVIVGMCRLIFKPIVTCVHAVVDATPTTADNEAVAKVEASKFYQAVTFALDYVASIKLPAAK